MQLHPDQIPENPVLETKLKPLDSLHMSAAEISQEYYQQNKMIAVMRIGGAHAGTADQRSAAQGQ